jgi:ABC-type cobalamin/Fe3+-siderophores transport system ATPase subunit
MHTENIFIKSVQINHVRHLKNINISISETSKKHLILTGKNGSGKTSVLEAIAKFLKSVYYDNFNLTSTYQNIKNYEAHLIHLQSQLNLATDDSKRRLNTDIQNYKVAIKQFENSISELNSATVDMNDDLTLAQLIVDGKFIIDFEKYFRIIAFCLLEKILLQWRKNCYYSNYEIALSLCSSQRTCYFL